MESPVISNLPISGTLRALRKLRILGRYSEVPFPEEVNMEMMNEGESSEANPFKGLSD